ncbi:insulin-like growth factor-binding protein 3 receptor [Aplochiton taeniatus]
MGFWHPMKNLKDYVSQHPPGVTFFLCLLILALSFICLGTYVNSQSLPNPDNVKDWNHLLLSLSRFHLCMTANASSTEATPAVEQRTDETNTGKNTFTCLSISAPTLILPVTPHPPECPAHDNMISHVQVVPKIQLSTGSKPCFSLQSTYDPTLTEMLTREQLGVAGGHLLEVGVCLIAVCVLLCLSVILTHSHTSRYQGNGLDVHREPLLDS